MLSRVALGWAVPTLRRGWLGAQAYGLRGLSDSSRSIGVEAAWAVVEPLREHVLDQVVFVGTAQYDDDDTDAAAAAATPSGSADQAEAEHSTRFTLCSLGRLVTEPYSPTDLGLAELQTSSGADALHHALLQAGALGVVHGEIDSVGSSKWSYGFFHDSSFSVFHADLGPVCSFVVDGATPALWLPQATSTPLLPVADIANVCVTIGDAPWDQGRCLVLRTTQGEELAVLSDDASLAASTPEECDPLLALMVETTWLVKAAGSLTLALRRMGGSAGLLLPRLLLPADNPWVEKRNAAWNTLFNNSSR